MTQKTNFFTELKDWSKRKHSIVKKYLNGFAKILGGSTNKPVYYVDGFAGRGTYEHGEKGSPVIAAELAEHYRDEGKSYRLYCINVECDPDNFANLQSETSNFGNLVTNFLGTFTDNLDAILSHIGNNPALFFLDDFGVSGTDWGSVEKLLRRKGSTDVWIRFDHKTVRRLDGFFASAAKSAVQKYAHLPQLYGIYDLDLLHRRLDGPSPDARIQNALALYLEQLEKTFEDSRNLGFASAYRVYSLNDQLKYHMVFACAHPKAARLASDIINGEEDNYQRERQEFIEKHTQQMSLFPLDPSAEEIFAEKVSRLKDQVQRKFLGQTITRSDLHYQLLCMDSKYWFGRMGRTHLTRVLEDLKGGLKPAITCDGPISTDSTRITFVK